MTVLAFLLTLAAIVVFLLAAFGAAVRVNLIAFGLALLSVAWIVQLTVGGHTIHT